jgi:hypothetical protein
VPTEAVDELLANAKVTSASGLTMVIVLLVGEPPMPAGGVMPTTQVVPGAKVLPVVNAMGLDEPVPAVKLMVPPSVAHPVPETCQFTAASGVVPVRTMLTWVVVVVLIGSEFGADTVKVPVELELLQLTITPPLGVTFISE